MMMVVVVVVDFNPSQVADFQLQHCTLVKVKGKASSFDIAPFTILNSGALQPRKWQLTGIDCSTAAQAVPAQSPR